MIEHAVELRGPTKRYADTTAVHDLTVDVLPGRGTGLLGPDGSGKSTTMRLTRGSVEYVAGGGPAGLVVLAASVAVTTAVAGILLRARHC